MNNDEERDGFDVAFDELANVLAAGLACMVESNIEPEPDQVRSRYLVHFEHTESSITPDPGIMIPDDHSLWFDLFSHFVDRCETWRITGFVDEPESLKILEPFADSSGAGASSSADRHGIVNDEFVDTVMENALGRYGHIRWFRFVLSSESDGFHFATEHFGLEFTVQSNDAADVDYLRRVVPESMHLHVWT